jgi:hypothetical protein
MEIFFIIAGVLLVVGALGVLGSSGGGDNDPF